MPKSHSPFGHKHHILSIDEDIKLHDSKINQVIDDINRIPHKKHTKIPSLIPLIIPPSTPFTTPTKTSKHTKWHRRCQNNHQKLYKLKLRKVQALESIGNSLKKFLRQPSSCQPTFKESSFPSISTLSLRRADKLYTQKTGTKEPFTADCRIISPASTISKVNTIDVPSEPSPAHHTEPSSETSPSNSPKTSYDESSPVSKKTSSLSLKTSSSETSFTEPFLFPPSATLPVSSSESSI